MVTGQDERSQLEYIARMSQELAGMAYQLDRKFIAYLLNMACIAAREEISELARQREECAAG